MSKPTFYPTFNYKDARAAMAWLEKAFGFEPMMRVENDSGGIAHAEMAFGDGVIMLGSINPLMGAFAVQHTYVAIEDPDAHHARAKAAGAKIVMELRDTDYGSRDYACEDLEGHRWYFGTYRPGPQDRQPDAGA